MKEIASEGNSKLTNMDTSKKETEVAKMETKNAYDQKASMEAMDIDKNHPIRFIVRCWKDDLTQGQWDEVRPRIVAMLQECPELYHHHVGEYELLETPEMAIEALEHEPEVTGKGKSDPNLPESDRKHISALEWAVWNLVHNDVLESRIKKIVGAGLTCLIGKAEWLRDSEEGVGISVIKFPEAEGKKILTECLKAYRVWDDICLWDIEGFAMGDDNLYKMAQGRNLLACFAMIDMQVKAWVEKAEKLLEDLSLAGVEGILLGEADTLSRSDFKTPWESTSDDKAMLGNFIRAIRNRFPLAINNDDMIYADVGFSTVGGKLLAELGPIVFRLAQLTKKGCQWQLIGPEYQAVWLTVGTELVAPLPMERGLEILKAFNRCEPSVFPSKMSNDEKTQMIKWMTTKRRKISDSYFIDSIDEDEEVVNLKRKAP